MPPKHSQGQVGQYYLMEKIAQGGMAEIFKGLSYDVHGLKKTVCIKKILPQLSASKEFIDSLIDEAKLAVKLVHGNIAQTYDLGKVGDDYFMVMEYVDGRSLSQIHKKCQANGELIPIPCLLSFIGEVASGLNYMHRRADERGAPLHVVHRDISPQNIMVSYSGTVKIIDFGIAKAVFKVGSTDSGILKGKFAYMSPEQAHGDAIDHRSDIFSLGIILHEMLTGKRLFKGEDSRQTIRNVRRAKVDPPSLVRPDIPEELDRIVIKALAKDRRYRYPFASEMHDDLVKFLSATAPDFKPSDVAAFLEGLFRHERGRPDKLEADARTPHLIIDRSNSALADDSQFEATGAARAPTDMGEYMLEEPTTARTASATADAEEASEAPLPDEIHPAWPPEAPADTDAEEGSASPPTGAIGRTTLHRALRAFLYAIVAGAILIIALGLVRKFASPPPDPERSTAFAGAMVITDPPDATVALDGKIVGQGSPVTLRKVTADQDHALRVSREGYLSQEQPLRLNAGEFTSLSITLRRSGAATASIEILSSPPGAKIFVDDRETSATTPSTIPTISADQEHTIGLSLAGHRFWSRTVRLKPGETKSFDVNLARNFGALSIHSSPEKALVMIDGIPVGQTPVTREDLEPDRIYRVEVWLEGHQPIAQEIKAVAGRKEELHLTLIPQQKIPEASMPQPPAAKQGTPPTSGSQKTAEPSTAPTSKPPPETPSPKQKGSLLEEAAPM